MARIDFDGDGRSDLLLRNNDGWLTALLGTANGGLTNSAANTSNFITSDWRFAGAGDFNGDGRADFLLRHDGGQLTEWLATPSGGFANNGANASIFFTPDWHVVGTGDFNGDGRDDFLLRQDGGQLTEWLGTVNGGFIDNSANASLYFASDWIVVGTGDFNGDSYSDLLLYRTDGWVTNWLGSSDGSFTNNGANTSLFFTKDWNVVGTGDFNGDGRDDLVLRRDDGWITDWLGTDTGGFVNNGVNTALYVTTDWKIDGIGDFNGDGNDDLVLRRDDGWITDWLGTDSGNFVDNGANFSTFASPNWQVQDPFVFDPWPGFGAWDY